MTDKVVEGKVANEGGEIYIEKKKGKCNTPTSVTYSGHEAP